MAAKWEDQYLYFFRYLCLQDEENIVATSKPLFYKRYVNGAYVRMKTNETDQIYKVLNSYNQNIKLTLDLNSTKFLDIEFIHSKGKLSAQLYSKIKKPPVHWISKILV